MSTPPLVRTIRIRRRAAVVLLSTLAAAGVVSGGAIAQASADTVAASAATRCPSGVTGGAATKASAIARPASWSAAGVPWRRVGNGWILADLAKSSSVNTPASLYLVSPGGHRYRLGPAPAGASLKDWSGNGANALFVSQQQNSTTATIIVVSLRTGKASSFRVYSGTPYPGLSFSRPSGAAILVQTWSARTNQYLPLQRFSLTGTRQLCYPAQFPRAGAAEGNYLENASGTEIVLSTQNGMEVVSNSGKPVRALATKYGQASCQLLNWWARQSVAADCDGQLLTIPLSGARPGQLTTSRDPGTFLDAWHVASGNYAEAAACGTTWLEKLNPNGTAKTLTIPGAAKAGTVHPLGTYANQLPLLIGGGCGTNYPYSIVDWYNPAANTARTVIGGKAGGGGYVTAAVLFPAR